MDNEQRAHERRDLLPAAPRRHDLADRGENCGGDDDPGAGRGGAPDSALQDRPEVRCPPRLLPRQCERERRPRRPARGDAPHVPDDAGEGGETIFPNGKTPADHNPDDWSECAKGKLGVKPKRGDAMLFYSLTPDGRKDPTSLHGSCPVVRGVKYSTTRWMHVHPFMVGPNRKDPKNYPESDAVPVFKSLGHGCTDKHESCEDWEAAGECEKNPGFMLESCEDWEAAGECEKN